MNDTFLVVGTPAPPLPKFNVDRFASSALTSRVSSTLSLGGEGGEAQRQPTSITTFRPRTRWTQGVSKVLQYSVRLLTRRVSGFVFVMRKGYCRSMGPTTVKKTWLYKTIDHKSSRSSRRQGCTKHSVIRLQGGQEDDAVQNSCPFVRKHACFCFYGRSGCEKLGPGRCLAVRGNSFLGGQGGMPKHSLAFNVLDDCFWADITRYMRTTEEAWESLTTRPVHSTRTA